MPLRLLHRLKWWRALVPRVPPYLPVAVWLSFMGWESVGSKGIAPDALRELLPAWLVWCWTFGIALGGLGAVLGALTCRTRLESGALALLSWGIGLWGVSVVVVGPDDRDPLVLMVCLLAMCALRLETLARAREAKRRAAATVLQWRSRGDGPSHRRPS